MFVTKTGWSERLWVAGFVRVTPIWVIFRFCAALRADAMGDGSFKPSPGGRCLRRRGMREKASRCIRFIQKQFPFGINF